MIRPLGMRVLAVAAIAAAATCALAGDVAFVDDSWGTGIDFFADMEADMDARPTYNGGTVGDFNRDGWPDLFLLGGGGVADGLFINDGDGTFTDRATAWGVDVLHRGRGATVGDFNNDRWPDIYVTSGGDLNFIDRPGENRLYRNNGNGTFTDIALAAGVHQTSAFESTATSATFGDYDHDGDLDLYVCGWEAPDGNRLFRNNGDETFTDVTVALGINESFDGYSPRFVDMDGDRWPELLVTGDFGTSRYFKNDGDGTFTNITAASGTGLEHNGMGATVADFNRDGLPEWYVASIYNDITEQDGNYLYINQGAHTYTVLPEAAGARNGGWSWGVDAVDIDHDGQVDIVATNGWIEPQFMNEPSYLFQNDGELGFVEVHQGSGFDHWGQGRGLLVLDHDRDGDMDVVITAFDEPVFLYRNDLSGTDIHWIEIALDTSGTPGLAPDGYGSRVIVTAGGETQYGWLDGGATYLGRSQAVVHFGLGAATTISQLTVEWANGTDTVLTDVAADQILTIDPSMGGGGPGAPGEASGDSGSLMRASYDSGTGRIDVSYAAACDALDHTIYHGDLADVSTYGYAGAECGIGISGSASFDPGAGDTFFVVVGTETTAEGSYGQDDSGVERPEDIVTTGCDVPQDLSGTCDLP